MKNRFFFCVAFFAATLTASAAVTITTTSKMFTKDGGAASVLTGGSGTWTATTDASWITFSRASGNAGVSCVYVVSANFSADTRSAVIDIAGNAYTVTQTGYTATLSPTSATLDYTGGSGAVSVTVDAGVSWSTTANVDWLSVSPASGMSAGTVTYTVEEYPDGVTTRTGSLTIAGQTFTVTQTGQDVAIMPATVTLGPAASVFEVTVNALATTSWSLTPNDSWVSVVDDGYGYGNSTIMIAVGQNPSVAMRTGTVSIGLKTLTIMQSGMTTPSLSITPTEAAAAAVGAYGNVAVYSTPESPWVAESLASWITLSEGTSGAGNGNTKYVASANPLLEPRTGQIKFRQVYREPENELDTGRILLFGTNTTANLTGWNMTLGRALNSEFNGTFNFSISGDSIPKQMKNDWSIGLQFRIGELNRVNRLFQFLGNHSLYFDANNTLWIDDTETSLAVTRANADYRLLVSQDTAGVVRLYLMQRDNGRIESHSFSAGTMYYNFTSGATSVGNFKFGYSPRPSGGNLLAGSFSEMAFWMRKLSDAEAMTYLQDIPATYETAPKVDSITAPYTHLSFSMNGSSDSSEDNNVHLASGRGITISGSWSEFSDRTGMRQRAMYSNGNNTISVPFVKEKNSTHNFWIYLNSLPSAAAWIFAKQGNGNYATHAERKGVAIGESGQICFQYFVYDQGWSGPRRRTNFGGIVPLKKWTMITLVENKDGIVTCYVDGVDVGNSTFNNMGTASASIFGADVTGNGFNGAIDDFIVYDTALTAVQVQALYEATKPKERYHTVTQGYIDSSVSPTAVSFNAAGGSTNVQLTVAAVTQWTASSGSSWINLTSSSSGAGSTPVSFDVSPNPSTEARTGTLTLAGKMVTVTQSGLWSQLTYDGTVFNETSDSGWIDVQVEGDGTWTASTDASWLTLLDTQGHGSASVMFVVDDFNTTVASRTATVTIAGKQVQVTQRGYELSIDPAVAEIGSNAGAGEIGITAPIDAVWEALVTADWISLVGGTTGVGSGTLRYTVADNTTGQTRTGKIVISGQEYTVTQHPYLTLTTVSDGQGSVAGGGNFETNERATLTATPATGYVFSHWSGDAVGVSNVVSFTMDSPKTVTAHFIPEGAAQRLAEEKAAQGGFYTRDQMRQLALGDTVIEIDGNDGNIGLTIQLQERPDLGSGSWQDVDMHGKPMSVDSQGRVHLRVPPHGNSAFYRLVNKGEE